MLIDLTLSDAQALASNFYAGSSVPLTIPTQRHFPLDCDWWRTPLRSERLNSDRHRGALSLYLALAKRSATALPANSFPSAFHFSDKEKRIPDKGFIRMCLNVKPSILSCRMSQGHLIFDVTQAGYALLETE